MTADWRAIVDAGIYTQEEVDQMKAGGTGYLGDPESRSRPTETGSSSSPATDGRPLAGD